jgi:lipopolysaccharide biosynthesis glycosyltransferase
MRESASEFVDVAFCADPAYVQPLTVAAASVLACAKRPERLRLWLVTREFDARLFAPFVATVTAHGARPEILNVPERDPDLQHVPLNEHLSVACYYRLWLPRLLPASVRRLAYLDCDVVACHAIEDLWAADLAGEPLAAVHNPRALNRAAMGLRDDADYFNSGVVLLDLDAWRRERLHERALEFALNYSGKLLCCDQDALNAVLAGRWRRLELRWNQQTKFFQHPADWLGVDPAALSLARTDPFVVHYTTTSKPWHYWNDHPWRSLYFHHLDRTPYRGWRPRPRDFRERVRHTAYQILPRRFRLAATRRRLVRRFGRDRREKPRGLPL